MEDSKILHELDWRVQRARAFNEVIETLACSGEDFRVAIDSVKAMYYKEMAAFDALWDEYQSGRTSAPVSR